MTIEVEQITIRDRKYFAISIDGAEYIQRTDFKPGLEESISKVEEILIRVCERLCENKEEKEKWDGPKTMEETKFMQRFGWEFPGHGRPSIKLEIITGKVLAHEGDETWHRDLKAARE